MTTKNTGIHSLFLFSVLIFFASVASASDAGKFESLFDGKSLAGWHGEPLISRPDRAKSASEKVAEWNATIAKHWSVKDGIIVNDGQGDYLTTDKDYGDFELMIEYRTVPKADSGIFLRGNPQVQIWDRDDESQFINGSKLGSGGLWNNPAGSEGKDPLVVADNKLGEWNAFRIIMIGDRVSVWLNDKQVVRFARMQNYFDKGAPLPKRGPIQLQTHGGEICWRNIRIREFDSNESNKLLAENETSASVSGEFKELFDGSSMKGWLGATDNYEVDAHAIQCKSGKGGVLYTDAVFENFELQIEFQLPPAGNNGIAIRYPGDEEGGGDGAYAGMCELQVLDDAHEEYKSIDPRQAHGSAYGMVAAKRGYLRPVGEWNHELIEVIGSKIKVELNGVVILDTDLADVKEFMAKTPHPGKDRTKGHIGLAGHSDPVKFRKIAVRKR